MRVYEDLSKLTPKDFSNPVATVGVFDGLHVGHQQLLLALKDWATECGGESVVITFRTHPRAVLAKSGPTFIVSLHHRLLLLEREGIDATVVLSFTTELAEVSAEQFSRKYLKKRLGLKGLLFGFNSSVGRKGEGDYPLMRKLGEALGFTVRQSEAVKLDGQIVSSTVIRGDIVQGRLKQAERMLGRPVAVLGTVVKGEGRGMRLDFPTANLDLHHEAYPPGGVYAALAIFSGKSMPALVNIGTRPTFHPGESAETIEVHIPGFTGNLYGAEMEVQFISKIRRERSFASAEELRERMRKDRDELLRIVSENSPEAP